MGNFLDAPIKKEGQWVSYDGGNEPTPEEIELLKTRRCTTWIEFSLPEEWEEECWAMIEAWLKKKEEEGA